MSLSNEEVIQLLDDYLHGLLDDETALEVEQRCEKSPACKDALKEARARFSSLRADLPSEASEQLIQETFTNIQRHIEQRRRWTRRFLTGAIGTLAAAVLVVVGLHVSTANMVPTSINMAVLGQRDLLAATVASLRIRLTDHSRNQPLANVPVTIELKDRTGQSVQLASLTTDALGSIEPRFAVPDWKDGKCIMTITAKTPRGTEVVNQEVQLKRSWQLMLSSDKPVYQPGQTIHVRSLALRRPDLKPVGEQGVVYSIADPKGNVIYKHTGNTSPYGIASTDCELATELLEGPYTIACKVGDTESRLQVQVLKYVLPKFKVALKLDKTFYLPNEKARLTIQANYFFGKPVADGTVEVDVRQVLPTNPVLLTLKARTDAQGNAAVEYTIPNSLVVRLPEVAPPGQPIPPNIGIQPGREPQPMPFPPAAGIDARLIFQARVTDSADQKQTGSIERLVTSVPVRIAVFPEGGTLVENVPNTVYVLVTRADGSPVKTSLRVSSIKQDLSTDERGAATFQVTPRTRENHFTVRAVDNQGTTLAQQHEVLLCGDVTNDFLVRTDKAVYRGGESMKLTALGAGSEPVFVDFIQDNGKERITLLSNTIDVQGGRGDYTLDLPADLSGTLELCAYRLNDEGLTVRKSRVVYVSPASDLRIKTTLDRADYRPGDKARLNLTLTDSDGKPTAGAISLAGVDEAVFAVLPQAPGMERTFFTLEQELLKPVFAIYPWTPMPLPAAAPNAAQRGRFEQALFAATARDIPTPTRSRTDNIKRKSVLPTSQGNGFANTSHTLMVASYGAKVKENDKEKQRWLRVVLWGWLTVLGFGLVSGYAALWCLCTPPTLFKIHLIGGAVLAPLAAFSLLFMTIVASGDKATFQSVGAAMGRGPVAMDAENFANQTRMDHTKSIEPSAPAGEGAKPEVGEPAPRVREHFPETLLWKPLLIADDKGQVPPLDINLADSITEWRLTASAVSAEGRLGAAQMPLKVFQPFFVDLNLPVAMTRGDEVSVPVVVYNYLDKPQTVTLKLADGNWFERQGEAQLKIDLQPGEVRATSYRLKAVRVGTQELQVAAQGQGAADALKKTIEVIPDGRREEQVFNGTLQDVADHRLDVPATAIEGSTKAFLKIYPSSFSQVVEGMENVFRLPYGCFEQTSSTTYPNVLALDYLKRTGRSQPQVEARARQYIHLGYQRLLTFETRGGGFDWFGQGQGNVRLTSYGLMEFTDMARVHDVDPALLERTRQWLLSKRQADGSWPAEVRTHHGPGPVQGDDLSRLGSTAYAAWAVYSSKADSYGAQSTLAFLTNYRPNDLKDPYLLALVANALLAIDPSGKEADPYVERLEFLKHISADGKFVWWSQDPMGRTMFYGAGVGAEVEATSMAVLALAQTKRHPGTVRNALAWLVSKKDPQGLWYSTQATVLGLKALLAGTSAPVGEGERRIVVKLGEQFEKEIRIAADQADVMQQVDLTPYLKAGANHLTVKESTDTAAGYQVTFRYHVPEAAKPDRAESLSIDLTYDRKNLAVNDILSVTARVRNHMQQDAAMVMLDLPVPAGFVPVGEDFAALVAKGTIARYQVTPRQVLVYLRGLPTDQPLQLNYRLRAGMQVKIVAPGARVYEYYTPERQGRSSTVALTVTARP